MAKFMAVALILFSFSSHALDMSQYKERLREHVTNLLGEDIAAKIWGKKESPVKLPEIPQVKSDATSTDVYKNKDRAIEKQGAQFESLSLEQKRKYHVAFVQELYQVTRNSEPKEGDILKFLNVLEQGGSREGVYRAITLDEVYASLEAYEEAPEKGLEDFAIAYGEKYLARKFDRDAMGKMNLWSIKRILVEKTLDVMDALADKPEDLHVWYAVLSAQLARDYSEVWKNKVRLNTSEEYHLRWAQSAPFQHIKSETIIKLHETMNYLNQSSL